MADSELLRADKGVIEFASEVAGSLTSSPRGYCKLLRVGRTIADLDGRRDMRKSDISEASVYRRRF
jgi:magnesium chelatase family protein